MYGFPYANLHQKRPIVNDCMQPTRLPKGQVPAERGHGVLQGERSNPSSLVGMGPDGPVCPRGRGHCK